MSFSLQRSGCIARIAREFLCSSCCHRVVYPSSAWIGFTVTKSDSDTSSAEDNGIRKVETENIYIFCTHIIILTSQYIKILDDMSPEEKEEENEVIKLRTVRKEPRLRLKQLFIIKEIISAIL